MDLNQKPYLRFLSHIYESLCVRKKTVISGISGPKTVIKISQNREIFIEMIISNRIYCGVSKYKLHLSNLKKDYTFLVSASISDHHGAPPP
jgi:hypothetical protein